MPNTTPIYGFRYPTVTEDPNVCRDLENLAEDVEATMAAAAAAVGLAARANANQQINAGGLSFLNLASAYHPPVGITWNGSNQATIVTAGRYSMYCGVSTGFISGANYSCCIVNAAAPGAGVAYVAAPTFSSNTTDSSVSATRWLDAGTIIRPAVYNNSAQFNLTPATQKPAEFEIWRVS